MNKICITTADKAIATMLKNCGLTVDEKEDSFIAIGMKFLAAYNTAAVNDADRIAGTVAVEHSSDEYASRCAPKLRISIETEEMK